MKWVLVLMLAACGGKKDDAKPAVDVAAVVLPAPTTVLDEAKRLLAMKPKRNPVAWALLAQAQIAAKQNVEAKATVEAALAIPDRDAETVVRSIEVLVALGDAEGAAKLVEELTTNGATTGALLSPVTDLKHPATIERLAELGATWPNAREVAERVEVESPQWTALVAKARTSKQPVATLHVLAQRARRVGKAELGRALIVEAVDVAQKTKDEMHDASSLASEAALAGETALAKKLVAELGKWGDSEEAAQRAFTFAQLAEALAIAGDVKGSEGYEKKARIAEEAAGNQLEEDATFLWSALAGARAHRKDIDGTLAIIREHLNIGTVRLVVYELFDEGARDAAERIVGTLKGEEQHAAITDIVELEAWRDVDAATKRVLAATALAGEPPGIDHVMRAYALAGNVAAVRGIGRGPNTIALDAFTDLAAQTLARKGKCDEAIAAGKDVRVNRDMHLAAIARYCPNSKL